MQNNQTEPAWYVEVSGQVYGPYGEAHITSFIQEGRIVAGSMISQQADSGFSQAQNFEYFRHVKASVATQSAGTQYTSAPQSAPVSSVFLIMAEINSDNAMQFLGLLQQFGKAERIGDTVWLLKAPVDINTVHSKLSGTLTRQDRLFIHDSLNNKTAWHNIGADMDQRIREMWNIQG